MTPLMKGKQSPPKIVSLVLIQIVEDASKKRIEVVTVSVEVYLNNIIHT